MSKHLEKLSRTGRTTKMLRAALEAAIDGKEVCVATATQADARDLEETFGKETAAKLGIKFKTTTQLNLNWESMTSQRHGNYTLLVDHYAIETKLSKALEMLHRFDN